MEHPKSAIQGTKIAFITVYRVCRTRVSLETNMAYAKQWKELTGRSCRKVDPREKTLYDLEIYVMKEIEKKSEVITLMGANESAENRTDEMFALIQECELVDAYRIADLYSNTETYTRGKEKIDYILTIPRVKQRVTYKQITSYNEWIISDHIALKTDIDYKKLEARDLAHWQGPERTFASSETKGRWKFV